MSTNAVAGPRESGPATRSAGESPDSDSASPGVPFAWALLALGLLLVSALLPTGPPRWLAGGDTYRWRGLGYLLDEGLLGGGDVTFRQVVTLRRGDELQLVATTSLGAELAIGALYAATLALALVVLRRRAPRALSPGSWRRGALALWDVLVVLFPLVGLGCAGALRFLPRFVGGAELVGAVAGFVQPLLAEPWGALLLGLRFVVLGPLAEEAAWRGVVYLGLRRRLGPVGAGVLSSLAFAAWHLIAGWDLPAALVVQYAFGLAACALVERTGSLWPGFALHALGNALALALYALCMASPETLLALLGV
ncbi:MAG: lysostaphin resistance A-like protein [Planctomycetota bacterium]